jgi:hypothetical protein
MIAAGKMTARGLAVFKPDQKTESYPTSLPADLKKRFRADSKAVEEFRGLSSVLSADVRRLGGEREEGSNAWMIKRPLGTG